MKLAYLFAIPNMLPKWSTSSLLPENFPLVGPNSWFATSVLVKTNTRSICLWRVCTAQFFSTITNICKLLLMGNNFSTPNQEGLELSIQAYIHLLCVWWFLYVQTHTCVIHNYTSSTAQSGGGSFKNRKPIGEVGCCESRMAERRHWWTDKWLRPLLFLCLSFFLYKLSIYLSIYLSVYLSIYLSIHLSIHPSIPVTFIYIYIWYTKARIFGNAFSCWRFSWRSKTSPVMEMVQCFKAVPCLTLGSAPRQQRPHPWSLGSQYHHLALGNETLRSLSHVP